ncbi:MAG: nitrogen-fixing NifU domain-containing protein [Promethearchaeota archaeon CR_4]|nr:MAG: nitrogen-fixing NifU domain-containing protein [Candidatus Lokiarchaeota archaeon CR_4]
MAVDEAKVKNVLNKLRGNLQADGGDLEYVGLKGDVVQIRLQGHCVGCMHAQQTLKLGIERIVKQEVPSVKGVEAVD